MEYQRSLPILIDPIKRIDNWEEFHEDLPDDEINKQAARCMNCGVPFCHTGTISNGWTTGCPVNNLVPEWNDLVYLGKWKEAYERLAATNNFPEFTGRVCPAPCETSCVLGINEEPVMIKEIEVSIIDHAFKNGWVTPNSSIERSNKKVAVIGSGPAGLACAQQLNRYGHSVTVFERSDRVGGLLMYGIPNMKLDKKIVDRRVDQLGEEGIEFCTGVSIGTDISGRQLQRDFDAIVLSCGSPKPRDLEIPGRESNGIHYAMEFLTEATKNLNDQESAELNVRGKNVIVIGGGDTGTDCVATAIRQGCANVTQFEVMQRPADKIRNHDSWLARVRTFQSDYGQQEAEAITGSDPRAYRIMSKRFIKDKQGCVSGVETVEVNFDDGKLKEVEGSENIWPADAVFLAMGFVGNEENPLFEDLGVRITGKNTIAVGKDKQTDAEGVFAAGDCERGQSLVVWAIADGRKAAEGVNAYLADQ